MAWLAFGALVVVQGLSFAAVALTPELSGQAITPRMQTVLLVALACLFYLGGTAMAAVLARAMCVEGIVSLRSAVSVNVFRARMVQAILCVDLLLLLLWFVHDSIRREAFTGLMTFVGIPVSLVATKLPLIYALVLDRVDRLRFAVLSLHYVFIAWAYESKMGLIYIVLMAVLFLRAAGIAMVGLLVAVAIGLMVIWTVVMADSAGFQPDNAALLQLAVQAFLNRFDSLKVAFIALESVRHSLATNNIFEALATLLPSCTAASGCLNLSAQISDRIVGIDITLAVYEINVATEAAFLLGPFAVPAYAFVVAFIAQLTAMAVCLRFDNPRRTLPVSAVCYVLFSTSIWSAGLLSTRVLFFFLLELVCLVVIVKALTLSASHAPTPALRA